MTKEQHMYISTECLGKLNIRDLSSTRSKLILAPKNVQVNNISLPDRDIHC